jgi:hypothetical protein
MRRGRELSRNERLDRRRRLLEMHALDERLKVVLLDLSMAWRGVGFGGTTHAHRHTANERTCCATAGVGACVVRMLCATGACVSVVPMEAAHSGLHACRACTKSAALTLSFDSASHKLV